MDGRTHTISMALTRAEGPAMDGRTHTISMALTRAEGPPMDGRAHNRRQGLDGRVHPLADVLRRAAAGSFPEVDGEVDLVPPWHDGVEGVLAMTGHAYLAVSPDLTEATVESLGANGFGGASNPRLVAGLAGSGWIDALDIVLVCRGTGGTGSADGNGGLAGDDGTGSVNAATGEPALVPRSDLRNHPRAQHATSVRSKVKTFGYAAPGDKTLVTLSLGLGGLPEVGVEADPDQARPGGEIVRDALTLVEHDEIVVAACAPGNARALRAFLSAGFVPVASVQLWRPARD